MYLLPSKTRISFTLALSLLAIGSANPQALGTIGGSPVTSRSTPLTPGGTQERGKTLVGPRTVAVAPTSLTAIAVSPSQINLTWSASSGTGISYSIFASTVPGFTPNFANQIASGITTTSYSSTGLLASVTYYYLVEALSAGGSSPASNSASATTLAAVPSAPTGLVTATAGASQINLMWNGNSGSGITYNVYASTSTPVTITSSNQVATGLTTPSYQHTSLLSNTTYYYTVTAVSTGGESSASSSNIATTLVSTPIPQTLVANLATQLNSLTTQINTLNSQVATLTSSVNALTFSNAEIPSGTINRTNLVFTLGNTPTPAAGLRLFKNGFLLQQGTDYTLSGSTIAFVSAAVPSAGDALIAFYQY